MRLRIFKYTPKFGVKEINIDLESIEIYNKIKWNFYSTERHYGVYVVGILKGKHYRLHRMLTGALKNEIVDHIDGNPLNNCISNLRITDHVGNNINARPRYNKKTSSYKGVHQAKNGKWKAQIQFKKQKIPLGTYNTELEAKLAYDEKAKLLFGEYIFVGEVK